METVVEVVESKKDEVLEKVVEQVEEKKEEIEQKVDEVADKAEEAIEKVADAVSEKIEEVSKPIADIIESNPQVAKVVDVIEDRLDGREISCSCFGWLVALRIARKSKKTSQAKPEEIPKTQPELPSQDSKAQEERPPTAPQSE